MTATILGIDNGAWLIGVTLVLGVSIERITYYRRRDQVSARKLRRLQREHESRR